MNTVNLLENQTIESYYAQAGAPGAQVWKPSIVLNPKSYTVTPIAEVALATTTLRAPTIRTPVRPHGIRELASPLSD